MPMTRVSSAFILAALVSCAGARDACAALFFVVETAQSPTSHSYDLFLDTEGDEFFVFDAFGVVAEIDCPGCVTAVTATDNVANVSGSLFVSTFEFSSNHWGGVSIDNHPPVEGWLIGALQIDHIDTSLFGGGRIEFSLTLTGIGDTLGPLPNNTCADPGAEAGCLMATIVPEPGAPLLLAAVALVAAAARRRSRGRVSRARSGWETHPLRA